MSERKVLNKYYPPDFDPSKIPRARCPRNRQFTVRLMVPCNIKCYTCGEYIAKGKKFNARKEDVENMTYLGVRIYRFYIKCPGCLAEISFRTDPESTDYVIEAGAHRNFQALKLAEEQAAREEREAKEEIESNPMLLLENRTQQSQYEMEVLESLEDLRDMNERHAGIDLGKITEKYENERKMTQEHREELERMEALKALGYEMIEGQMIKRVAPEELLDASSAKKIKSEEGRSVERAEKYVSNDKDFVTKRKNTLKSKMAGLIKTKSEQTVKIQEVGNNTEGQSSQSAKAHTSNVSSSAAICDNIHSSLHRDKQDNDVASSNDKHSRLLTDKLENSLESSDRNSPEHENVALSSKSLAVLHSGKSTVNDTTNKPKSLI
ncbi:Coiled-coil domain-containing protein 94, partial [Halocaridina rubra]